MRPHTLLETLPNGPSFEMVLVEGGRFWRGEGKERHEVQLDDFYLGRTQVTQALWEAVMGSNPSAFPHPQRPVEQVSWYDCVEFCNALSGQQGYQPAYHIDREQKDPNNRNGSDDMKWLVMPIPGADGYRLPTEAEWEYAARGGRYAQPFEYAGSPNLKETAWWSRNSQDISQPVGLKAPNALGLFDMSGNVREWVWDWYDDEYYMQLAQQPAPPADFGMSDNVREWVWEKYFEQLAQQSRPISAPPGPVSGKVRGVRGGSWSLSPVAILRVASLFADDPDFRYGHFGCRLCRYPAR